jgi:hypothetical protein
MRTALALIGVAFIIASISEYHPSIKLLAVRTWLFSFTAMYNPHGTKGVAMWGPEGKDYSRPLLIGIMAQTPQGCRHE